MGRYVYPSRGMREESTFRETTWSGRLPRSAAYMPRENREGLDTKSSPNSGRRQKRSSFLLLRSCSRTCGRADSQRNKILSISGLYAAGKPVGLDFRPTPIPAGDKSPRVIWWRRRWVNGVKWVCLLASVTLLYPVSVHRSDQDGGNAPVHHRYQELRFLRYRLLAASIMAVRPLRCLPNSMAKKPWI